MERADGDSDRFVLITLFFKLLPHLSYIATWVACPISGFLDPNYKSSENGPPADDPRAMIALARVNWLHSRYKIVGCRHLRFVKTYEFCCFVVKRRFCVYLVLVRFRTSGERGLFGEGCVMAASDLSAYLAMGRALWMAGALPHGV